MTSERGWLELSSLREPYRQEGKTMGYEIAEQFGWNPPRRDPVSDRRQLASLS